MSIWTRVFGRKDPEIPVEWTEPVSSAELPGAKPLRMDGWYNTYTGLGTSRDKLYAGFFAYQGRIQDTELSSLYHGNDIAARIIETRPKEMFRRGYDICVSKKKKPKDEEGAEEVDDKLPAKSKKPGDDTSKEDAFPPAPAKPGAPADPSAPPPKMPVLPMKGTTAKRPTEPSQASKDREECEEIEDALTEKRVELCIDAMVLESMIWGGLFGGCLLMLGVKDGRKPDKPLNIDNVQELTHLTPLDRRFVQVFKYYDDPMKPKYGQPELYQVTPALGGVPSLIHESRVIRFDGAPTDVLERRRLAGWTYSRMQRCYEVARAFDTAFQSAANLLTDASQGVWKIKGLFDMIASGEQGSMQARMAMNDMMRSSARAVVLDTDGEEFERTATPLTGVSDLLDRFMMRLAAAAEMPVTILLGRSPAGENATGDSDFRWFYDRIAQEQRNDLAPVLVRIYTMIAKALGYEDITIEISFTPLWQPSGLEQAKIELTYAQRDDLYIGNQTLLPEEVAIARFGDNGHFNSETPIDVEARQQALDDNIDHMLQKASMMTSMEAMQSINPMTGEPMNPLIPPGPGGEVNQNEQPKGGAPAPENRKANAGKE